MNVLEDLENDSLDDDMLDNNKGQEESNTNSSSRGTPVRKSLFYKSSSPVPNTIINRKETPDVISSMKRIRFYEDDTTNSGFISPKMKEVKKLTLNRSRQIKLNQLKRLKDTKTSKIDPWDFRKALVLEFTQLLNSSDDHEDEEGDNIHWKKIKKELSNSIIQLAEVNMKGAIQEVFNKYSFELTTVLHGDGSETDKVLKTKETLMGEILGRMQVSLNGSKLPAGTDDQDMDVEYIVAKRKVIQERYMKELKSLENLEVEIFKQKEKLKETRTFIENLKQTNTQTLTNKLINNDLHPILNKAIENDYGIIKPDNGLSNDLSIYKKDIAQYNLHIEDVSIDDTVLPKAPVSSEDVISALPSLRKYREAATALTENISRFLKDQDDIVRTLASANETI
ncbi:hypothetical protein KAFR_0D01750 [Kazachstania africana CBS 2517]|uniref:Uncharacterized protein n=1 Tax=Kazachstania africana (strain ATCC 22294 / BCRC 22015 / CBS 2517 / CECT 1963 / NBRC 1671 / NRRL Y-8276) TaxID=1071382 RepID=H2ATX2_KAZAF|nr:hypothetical protein KAFR_0D01750 [Kazachstania africana CBS 2517]CCF57822.1 hypothetical protein KAFR_0D01750 [Kazachstania africana CBS 2517]